MSGPRGGLLDGIRVVELAMWVAGPATGGVMADWGAEVVKIEPPGGDPLRFLNQVYSGSKETRTPVFDMDNRGKRSVVLDLKNTPDVERAKELIATADVFLTNMRAGALERMGLDSGRLLATHPRLVYAHVTAYGLTGPARDEPGYDSGAFWARAGVAERFTSPGEPPPLLAGAFGDHVTSITMAAGVMAALYYRERHGVGQLVTTSLLRSGIYSVSADINVKMALGRLAPTGSRVTNRNPMSNCYQARDGRWFWLLGTDSQRLWPHLIRAIGREDLDDDERFQTAAGRRKHGPDLVAVLDDVFRTGDRDEWAQAFATHDVWWAPMNNADDLLRDPQAWASGAFVEVPARTGTDDEPVHAPATPIDFGAVTVRPVAAPPAIGEHTEEILAGQNGAAVAGDDPRDTATC
jgi:crotonobetainyl-CoA:carnitine CoA-transferase CaiB-like acyl-CoA transferase